MNLVKSLNNWEKSMSDVFKYDDKDTYESNFTHWYSVNSKERKDNMEESQSKKLLVICGNKSRLQPAAQKNIFLGV